MIRLLRMLCRPEVLEDIEGDVLEIHADRLRRHGRLIATMGLWYDCLRFVRPYTIRDSVHVPSGPIMLKNYVSVSFRHARRYPGFSIINVAGLAVGMAVAILTVLFVSHEQSFDRFHDKADRIARIHMTWIFGDTQMEVAMTTTAPGPVAKAELSEVEDAVRFYRIREAFWQTDHPEAEALKESGMVYADSGLFNVFSFPLVSGDPTSALVEPNSLVLTESSARKYFGTTDVVGNTLILNSENVFSVTGVMRDVPSASHIQFTMAASFSTLAASRDVSFDSSQYHTYALLAPGATFSQLQSGLDRLLTERFGDNPSKPLLHVTPITDVYLHSNVSADWSPQGDIRHVRMFSAIAILILLIACINYMNLATARSVNRAREVGMRKVLGAEGRQIFSQFVGEALMLTAVGMLLAFGLVLLALPAYNAFTGQAQTVAALIRPVYLLSAWLGVSLLAGAWPAFGLSNLLPARVLKGTHANSKGGVLLRRGLVVVQFAVTVVLIAGTITIHRQLDFMRDKELGYDEQQLVVIPIDNTARDRLDVLQEAMRSSNSIVSVAAVSSPPSGGAGVWTFNAGPDPRPDERHLIGVLQIDESWVELMGIRLLAGRGPTAEETQREGTTPRAVVLNEQAAALFGWTPDEAVGQEVYTPSRQASATVVGVAEDFHFAPLHEPIEPVIMHAGGYMGHILVRTAAGSVPNAIDHLRDVWGRIIPERPLDFVFQDERLNAQYRTEERMANLFSIFSGLAIFIACLGLLGLAAFTVVQRTREIGIRKVLGADPAGLAALLSREFVLLVTIAFLLATPLAWMLFDDWLSGFAYRTELTWWTFGLSGLLAVLVAISTVAWQALRAANMNPVESLRTQA
ncbi:MAG: ABC transporter permease [Rhodothermales bacterium]